MVGRVGMHPLHCLLLIPHLTASQPYGATSPYLLAHVTKLAYPKQYPQLWQATIRESWGEALCEGAQVRRHMRVDACKHLANEPAGNSHKQSV
jgi:hypothetical protein